MRPADKIERLIKAVSFRAPPKVDRALWMEILKEQSCAQLADPTSNRRGLGRFAMNTWITKIGVAGILAVGLVAGVLIGQRVPGSGTDSRSDASALKNRSPDLRALREMATAHDVKGLAMILSEGQFESKFVAANLLAKMAPLPALDTITMHAVGELRADRQKGNLRLYSTKYPDWLELTDSRLIVHSGTGQQQTTSVRLTHDREGDEQQWNDRQREAVGLRKELADLEGRLASTTGVPNDVNQLRERFEEYSTILDLMDRAIYISPANGGLRLEDRVYHREAGLFPSDSGVRAEWHGEVVDANGITLLHGLAPVHTTGPATPPADWRSRFDAVYSLAEGEILRWVRTPFIPERQYYTQGLHYYSGTKNPPPPLYMSFRWDGTLHQWALAMSEGSLGSVLMEFGLQRYELSAPEELLGLRLHGDWIVRPSASLEQKMDALEKILERELGRRIRFVHKDVEREVIVVRGRYEKRALEGHAATEPIHLIAGGTPEQATLRDHESLARVLNRVAIRFNRPMILEAQGLDQVSVDYQTWLSYDTWLARKLDPNDPFPIHGEEKFNPVLANLAKQTSLEFSREKRPFATWFITEIKEPNSVTTGDTLSR
jgi:hypothetical protein